MTDSTPPDDRPISLNQDHRLLREWIVRTRSREPAPFAAWMGLEFDAKPGVHQLERALTTIVERHEILRTAFTEPLLVPASRRPEILSRLKELPISASLFDQRVHADAPVTVSEGELDGLQRDWVSRTLRHDVLKAEVERRVRYDSPPLIRATLFRCDGDRYLLSIVLPHLVADGVSMPLLRKELATLYRSLSAEQPAAVQLPALEAQYADFAVWQRQQLATGSDAAMDYWRKQWAEFVPAVAGLRDIPYSRRVEPTPVSESDREAVMVDSAVTMELRAYCKRHGVTMYMAWLAAIAIMLRLYTGKEKVAILAHVANRARPQWHSLIGWFSNTYLCGINVPAMVGQAVLDEARRTALGAVQHQVVPSGVIWHALILDGTLERDFHFPDWLSLDYTTAPRGVDRSEPWRHGVWGYVAGRRRETSMAVMVADSGEELTLLCTYPVASFSPAGARQVMNDLQSVMRRLMRSPNEPIETYQHVLGVPPAQTV